MTSPALNHLQATPSTMESVSKGRAIKWIILTVFTPLSVSLFAANAYIVAWYMHMAMAGTPHEGPPPIWVIHRGVMLTAGAGLWFTLLLWWLLHRKTTSFSALYRARTNQLGKDVAVGALLGGCWIAVYGALGWPPFGAMFVANAAKAVSLPTSLEHGFCEEFLFRGFLILLIARAGGGWKAQVLWSSLAFGLGHIMWGPVGMLFTVAAGGILCSRNPSAGQRLVGGDGPHIAQPLRRARPHGEGNDIHTRIGAPGPCWCRSRPACRARSATRLAPCSTDRPGDRPPRYRGCPGTPAAGRRPPGRTGPPRDLVEEGPEGDQRAVCPLAKHDVVPLDRLVYLLGRQEPTETEILLLQ